ncbi:hypothetical protein EDM68_03515 [Candidatus Uhrbacteria bacterium]|nr:MAG: hypothetical protein EDM68_03515 [Candidatus Uhrbacteria bacterium]
MTKLDFLNRGDFFSELSDLARRNGVSNRSTWNDLVEATVESHRELGELDPDQDLQGLKDDLRGMWDEYVRQAGPMDERALDEDPETPRAE